MGTLTLMEQKFDFAYEAVCAMQCYTEIMLSNKEELVLQKAVTMLLDNKKLKLKLKEHFETAADLSGKNHAAYL